jgi:uncharacterized protein (TIGR01777 family)
MRKACTKEGPAARTTGMCGGRAGIPGDKACPRRPVPVVCSMKFRSRIDAPLAKVFAWHERPGALTRLSPPWLPVRVVSEAQSLRDGEAVFALPGGISFTSRHDPAGYVAGSQFVDTLPGWRHTHGFVPDGEGTWLEDHVQSLAPEGLVTPMFAYRHRQLAADIAAQSHWGGPKLTVAMTGASGLIGTALRALLTTAGHEVLRLVRRPPSAPDERHWAPDHPEAAILDGADVVVHLAGAPILGRFTAAHKQRLVSSRVGPTRLLAAAAGDRPFISASAIGYYGPTALGTAQKGTGFLADLVAEWEETGAKGRAVQVRTGLVLSPQGGLLGLAYPVFLAGLGGRIGNGRQWMSWISLDDLVDIYFRAIFDTDMQGPVNAVGPIPVTNDTFTRTLAHVLRRPSALAVPFELTRMLLGEGSTEFVEANQRLEPLADHVFRYPQLEPALRHMLGRTTSFP